MPLFQLSISEIRKLLGIICKMDLTFKRLCKIQLLVSHTAYNICSILTRLRSSC